MKAKVQLDLTIEDCNQLLETAVEYDAEAELLQIHAEREHLQAKIDKLYEREEVLLMSHFKPAILALWGKAQALPEGDAIVLMDEYRKLSNDWRFFLLGTRNRTKIEGDFYDQTAGSLTKIRRAIEPHYYQARALTVLIQFTRCRGLWDKFGSDRPYKWEIGCKESAPDQLGVTQEELRWHKDNKFIHQDYNSMHIAREGREFVRQHTIGAA